MQSGGWIFVQMEQVGCSTTSHILFMPLTKHSQSASDRQIIVRTLVDAGASVTLRLATRHKVLTPLSISAILGSSEMGSRRGLFAHHVRMITELLSTGVHVEEQDLFHFSNLLLWSHVKPHHWESNFCSSATVRYIDAFASERATFTTTSSAPRFLEQLWNNSEERAWSIWLWQFRHRWFI